MESVSLKLDSSLAKAIEREMRLSHYSTKTEFIREAIRDRLAGARKARAWEKLFAARGAFKDIALTDEEFKRKREEYSRELEKELKKEYNIK